MQDIVRLLDAFDLALVGCRTVSYDDCASMDTGAAAAIGLAVVSAVRTTKKPWPGEWIDDVERLNPSFFVLPPDAQDRFRRLLQTCRLDYKASTRANAHADRAGPHEGAGAAFVEEDEAEPARWHLWESVSR